MYTTKAFIFREINFGESDKLFSFFTEDFGRVDAVAQGVRCLKSKLRYSLSGNSFLRVSFVGTSNGYFRLVDAEEIFLLEKTKKSLKKTKSSFVLFSLIDRMLQGQEEDRDLWKKFEKIFMFLENSDSVDGNLKNFEILAAMHVLNHLGYLGERDETKSLSLDKIGKNGKYFLSLVQKTIEQSQL